MSKCMIVFRTAYMELYDGPGLLANGGTEPERTGAGGEMWNFAPQGGVCFGYVMTGAFAGVDLNRLAPNREWDQGDELADVDVVFIATKPGVGQVVVGWYRSATLFHRHYRTRPGRALGAEWEKVHYLCEVDATRAFLLSEEMRTFKVPYGPVHGEGYIGQSHVRYADSENEPAKRFVQQLREYIDAASSSVAAPGGRGRAVGRRTPWGDSDLMIRVERGAVETAERYYKAEGYRVRSVERDCRGWDLEVQKPGSFLRIEVKGHLGNVVQFELSPNEYLRMKEHSKAYRVFLVRDALGAAYFGVYEPREENGVWRLHSLELAAVISLSERIGAIAFEL